MISHLFNFKMYYKITCEEKRINVHRSEVEQLNKTKTSGIYLIFKKISNQDTLTSMVLARGKIIFYYNKKYL